MIVIFFSQQTVIRVALFVRLGKTIKNLNPVLNVDKLTWGKQGNIHAQTVASRKFGILRAWEPEGDRANYGLCGRKMEGQCSSGYMKSDPHTIEG